MNFDRTLLALFDRTTSLTEHSGNLGFDRMVNGEMFCQKNVISRVFCHIASNVMTVCMDFKNAVFLHFEAHF